MRRRISDAQEVVFYPVIGGLARIWMYTVRRWVSWSESGSLPDFIARGEPVILCAWHEDILPSMAYLITQAAQERGYPLVLMVSDGRAGALGGCGVEANGVHVVKGGKHSDGGRVSVVERLAEECTRTRRSAILTGDGSRGPAFEAKWGAVYLARDTGFPLVPMRTRFVRGLTLRKTWAGFMVPPIPGRGRAHAVTGEPLRIPADADKAALEAYREELERRLKALMPIVDAHLFGASRPPAGAESAARGT